MLQVHARWLVVVLGLWFGAGCAQTRDDVAVHHAQPASAASPVSTGGPGDVPAGTTQMAASPPRRPAGPLGDRDADGIPDDQDRCPDQPEDRDGYLDQDGCPDPDNDADGILDAQDRCPNQPETMNGFLDDDGCPDEIPDRDKDGIPDSDDACPDGGGSNVIRAKGESYGCPDRDRDGVPDKNDKCPDQPEDTDGFQDDDGCPDPDNDRDGVPDNEDECIDVPGPKANRGCPRPAR